MPNIRQYEAPELGLTPTDRGTSAAADAARRVGSFHNSVASATDALASKTSQLASETSRLGAETSRLGADRARMFNSLGDSAESSIKAVGETYIKYEDNRQISQGAAQGVEFTENATKRWNEIAKNADPNDPTTAAKFRAEVLEPELQKFKEGFTTEKSQAWAEQFVGSFRRHMYEKTSADMATLAGIAVQKNATTTINTLSSTVRTDPSSLDFALKQIDHSVGSIAASSPNLTPAQAAKVAADLGQAGKSEIVKSWLLGVAERSPEAAVRAVESGKYSEFISGSEAKQIIGYSRTNARLAQSEARSERIMREHQEKVQFNDAANKLEMSVLPQKAGDSVTLPANYWENVRKLGQLPGAQLDPGRLKTMVDLGDKITERMNKPEPRGPVSHETTMALFNRIHGRDGARLESIDAITQAYGDGKLREQDYKFLMQEFRDAKTPDGQALGVRTEDFLKAVGPQIDRSNPLMGKIDTTGKEGIYRFTVDLKRKIEEYRKENKNPHDLLDPSKPDYMGRPEALAPYQKSLQESLRSQALRLRGMPADAPTNAVAPMPPPAPKVPRLPNESPDAYLKRTGFK